MGADGVHIGQSDMPIEIARNLLPPGSIIGISVNTPAEAHQVVEGGLADYVGIGALWATNSKKIDKSRTWSSRCWSYTAKVGRNGD